MLRPDRPAGRVAGPPAALAANARGRGAGDCVGTADWADRQPVARLGRVGLQRHARQPLGAGVPTVCGRVVFSQRAGRMAGKRDAPAGGVAHNHATQITSLANLRPSQSNKVAQLGKLSPELFDNPTHPNGYFASVDDRASPMPNIPAAGHWRLLYLPYFAATEGWAAQIAVGAVENSGLCWRKARGPEWQAWEFAATTTPPQEYDLPLAAGATSVGAGYKNTYSKDQFGIVRVWFSIHFETLPAINQIVFQLPAGFKPSAMCCGSAYLSMGVYYQASINIDANGNGFVGYGSITHSGAINMHGFIEFPAVS